MRRTAVVVLLAVYTLASTASLPAAERSLGHKAMITGLIDKGSESPYHLDMPYSVVDLAGISGKSPAFSGIVVNETWASSSPAAVGSTSPPSTRPSLLSPPTTKHVVRRRLA